MEFGEIFFKNDYFTSPHFIKFLNILILLAIFTNFFQEKRMNILQKRI